MFRPPTQGSISGLLLAKAFEEAGIPAGVFNTITGRGSEIGDYIVEHKEVQLHQLYRINSYRRTYWSFSWYASYHAGTWRKDAALVN